MMTGLRTREPLGFEKFMEKFSRRLKPKAAYFSLTAKRDTSR